MSLSDDEFAARLEALRTAYVERLGDRVATVVAGGEAAFGTAGSRPDAELGRREAHNLAGTAESFGFPELGERARHLEACFVQALVDAPDPTALTEGREALRAFLDTAVQAGVEVPGREPKGT